MSDEAQQVRSLLSCPCLDAYSYLRVHSLILVQEEAVARLHKTETQLILSDLDTAVVLNLNEKQTRKQRLRGKVATFDVVEEYEKAVDLWVSVEHPNSKKMGVLLEKIARFLGIFIKLLIGVLFSFSLYDSCNLAS